MVQKNGMILMTAFLFGAVILLVTISLSPVQLQTTSIMAIVPSTENTHSVIFQVCAGDTIMRAPEVRISSDTEVKTVKLSKEILPESCRQTSAIIKATDSKTIKMEKVDKKNINIMITEVDEKILNIQSEITKKNAELEELIARIPEDKSPSHSVNAKINNIAVEISKLRNQLHDVKMEREKLLVFLKG